MMKDAASIASADERRKQDGGVNISNDRLQPVSPTLAAKSKHCLDDRFLSRTLSCCMIELFSQAPGKKKDHKQGNHYH